MRQLSVIPALLLCAATLLTGCATAQPEPEPAVSQADIPDPSRQKCATTTGSRLATTCSNMVKSTNNTAALREMQRHQPMSGGN
jgi:PBP1b-binding outer membrane lipoprotein LpoB